MCDFMEWVFFFDDMFDEGHLREDPTAARDEPQAHLAIHDDSHPDMMPIPFATCIKLCGENFRPSHHGAPRPGTSRACGTTSKAAWSKLMPTFGIVEAIRQLLLTCSGGHAPTQLAAALARLC